MNFGVGSAFSRGLGSAFCEGPGLGPGPLYKVWLYVFTSSNRILKVKVKHDSAGQFLLKLRLISGTLNDILFKRYYNKALRYHIKPNYLTIDSLCWN